MTLTQTRTTDRERARAAHAAIGDEIGRLNAAIRRGASVQLSTYWGPEPVSYVTGDMDAQCGTGLHVRTYALCNDGDWADLLRQAGVTRNPLFQEA